MEVVVTRGEKRFAGSGYIHQSEKGELILKIINGNPPSIANDDINALHNMLDDRAFDQTVLITAGDYFQFSGIDEFGNTVSCKHVMLDSDFEQRVYSGTFQSHIWIFSPKVNSQTKFDQATILIKDKDGFATNAFANHPNLIRYLEAAETGGKAWQFEIDDLTICGQCFKLEAADLDSVLFLRDAGPSGMVVPEPPDTDPLFVTNGDYLWAKFMAYERLQQWLEDELDSLRGSGTGGSGNNDLPGGGPVLKWTGETINLVEIAYGIWLTGQVNNGNASISEIVLWLEKHFAVRVGKAHRRWQNIAGRKRLSYTRYIDEIKSAIEKRVEEEFAK